MMFKVPSNPSHSMILRFYACMHTRSSESLRRGRAGRADGAGEPYLPLKGSWSSTEEIVES